MGIIIELGAHYNMVLRPHKYALVLIIIHTRVIVKWLTRAVLECHCATGGGSRIDY
jgi:hypothetical protein